MCIRDSRITGVLSVIGGWFITAGAAFTICFVVTLIMYYGGTFAMLALIALAIDVYKRQLDTRFKILDAIAERD